MVKVTSLLVATFLIFAEMLTVAICVEYGFAVGDVIFTIGAGSAALGR